MSKEIQEAIEEALEVAEGRGGDFAFTGPAQAEIAGKEVGSSGFSGFPTEGLVRLAQILRPLGPLPIGRSTWWRGVATGRYPKPVKLGPRITCWYARDILALIEHANLDGERP